MGRSFTTVRKDALRTDSVVLIDSIRSGPIVGPGGNSYSVAYESAGFLLFPHQFTNLPGYLSQDGSQY